jgi:RimJ/RimL family protein N-acetyltransferase
MATGSLTEVETDRLLLRTWRASDAGWFADLNADSRVMRFIGDGRPLDRPGSDALLERIRRHWDEHGYGLWAVQPRGEEDGIGFVGLAIPSFLPAVLPAVEVGWRLRHDRWGRGLATEAARMALARAWDDLGLQRVISIIDPGNAPSLRVAGKLGMRRGRDRVHSATRRRVTVMEADRPL